MLKINRSCGVGNGHFFIGIPLSILLMIIIPYLISYADCRLIPKYAGDKTDPKVERFYENTRYGYSVRIPEGIVGRTSPSPAPQHGFRVLFSESTQSYLWVTANSNSMEYKSVEDQLDDYIGSLKKHFNIFSRNRSRALLDGMPAVYQKLELECGGMTSVQETYTLLHLERGIIYEIGYSSSKAAPDSYKSYFLSVVKAFDLTPIN